MSLFSNLDTVKIPAKQCLSASGSVDFPNSTDAKTLKSFKEIEKHLSGMVPGTNKVFFSDGSWSNYELMAYLLGLTGPAKVAFTTWSISEKALTMMAGWMESGVVSEMFAVLDNGIRNRKPAIYQQAKGVLPNLKFAHCHAKTMAILSPEISFLVVGSANFTRNPRKEAGVVICDHAATEFSFNWIKNITDDSCS